MFHDDPPLALTRPPEAPPALEEGVRWRGVDLLAAAVLVVAGSLGVIAALFAGAGGARGDVEGAPSLTAVLVMLAFELWIGGVVLVLARLRGVSMRDLGFRRPRNWTLAAYALGGAYGAVLGYQLLLVAVESATGGDLSRYNQGNTLPRPDDTALAVWIALGVALVVVAPLAEELLFRGLVFRALLSMRGFLFALVVSGVAFSLMHFNLSVILPFALVGMVFAWAYRSSGSLWTTIAAHAAFNGMGFLALVMGVEP